MKTEILNKLNMSEQKDITIISKQMIIVLDASGSMGQFDLKELKEGVCKTVNSQENISELVLIVYSDKVQVPVVLPVKDGKPSLSVKQLDVIYKVGGSTAMNDALMEACKKAEEFKPVDYVDSTDPHTICMFITDGQENSSVEKDLTKVKSKIVNVQENGVTFLCMGFPRSIADVYGLPPGQCIEFSHNDRCMANVWESTAAVSRAYTSGGPVEEREYSVQHRSASAEEDYAYSAPIMNCRVMRAGEAEGDNELERV